MTVELDIRRVQNVEKLVNDFLKSYQGQSLENVSISKGGKLSFEFGHKAQDTKYFMKQFPKRKYTDVAKAIIAVERYWQISEFEGFYIYQNPKVKWEKKFVIESDNNWLIFWTK